MTIVNYANRGMGLETLIDFANQQYRNQGIAQVDKIATPVKVTKLVQGRIRDGWFEKKSTVDYIGAYKGRAIAFDAKSTREKTSMKLDNFEAHQVEFLRRWSGIKFVIVELSAFRETYFMPVPLLLEYWDGLKGRKSIPFEEIRTLGRIEQGSGIVLHYLKHVEVDCEPAGAFQGIGD